jgi:hypothetical protein
MKVDFTFRRLNVKPASGLAGTSFIRRVGLARRGGDNAPYLRARPAARRRFHFAGSWLDPAAVQRDGILQEAAEDAEKLNAPRITRMNADAARKSD